jgi:hypothetical protein
LSSDILHRRWHSLPLAWNASSSHRLYPFMNQVTEKSIKQTNFIHLEPITLELRRPVGWRTHANDIDTDLS